MKPTKKLPHDFVEIYAVDLSRNRKTLVLVNGIALILLIIYGWMFGEIITTLRPNDLSQADLWGSFQIINILFALAIMIILHEAIHGVLFWGFTRERPKIGVNIFYAYVAAPEWFIPKLQYALIGLAPLILLTLIGAVIIPIMSSELLPYLFFVLVLNAAGAAGDIYVVAKVGRYPKDILIKDLGDEFQIYWNE